MKNNDLYTAIRSIKAEYPGWRIGQIVSNVATWAKGPKPSALWDITDDEFIAAVEKHLLSKKADKVRNTKNGESIKGDPERDVSPLRRTRCAEDER